MLEFHTLTCTHVASSFTLAVPPHQLHPPVCLPHHLINHPHHPHPHHCCCHPLAYNIIQKTKHTVVYIMSLSLHHQYHFRLGFTYRWRRGREGGSEGERQREAYMHACKQLCVIIHVHVRVCEHVDTYCT